MRAHALIPTMKVTSELAALEQAEVAGDARRRGPQRPRLAVHADVRLDGEAPPLSQPLVALRTSARRMKAPKPSRATGEAFFPQFAGSDHILAAGMADHAA